MVGFSTPAHVVEAVAYETASAEERDYASVLAGAPRHAYLGQCTYCGHCAPCPKGIDIPTVNKFYDLAALHNEVPDSVRDHYRALDAQGLHRLPRVRGPLSLWREGCRQDGRGGGALRALARGATSARGEGLSERAVVARAR